MNGVVNYFYGKSNYNKIQLLQRTSNLRVGLFILDILTIIWVVYMLFSAVQFDNRPISLFAPLHWFSRIFMPSPPSLLLYFSIGILSIAMSFINLIKQRSVFRNTIVFLCVIWINLYKYSYGVGAHNNHLFLLAVFLTIPLPIKSLKFNSLAITFLQMGLLFPYSSSGLFKIIVLIKKILFENVEYTWLYQKALFYQTFISYRTFDEKMPSWLDYSLQLPMLSPFAMVLIMTIQAISIFMVFQQKRVFNFILILVFFHVANMILFKIFFWMSCFTLIALFAPYHRLRSLIKTYFGRP